MVAGEAGIMLRLQIYGGADDPGDEVNFDSDPRISVTVDGGDHGDVSTAAVVANVAPTVIDADPGRRSMTDLIPIFTREA